MPLGASRAGMLGAAGSGGAGGFLAWGGQVRDWVSTTPSVSGPMRAHVFYGNGKFRVVEDAASGSKAMHYCIVAGGGSTAKHASQNNGVGGAGGGGCRTSFTGSSAQLPTIPVSTTGGPSSDGVYPIVVGAGGAMAKHHPSSWNWASGNWYEYGAGNAASQQYSGSYPGTDPNGIPTWTNSTGNATAGGPGWNTVSNGTPSSALGLVATGGGTATAHSGGKPGGSGGGGYAQSGTTNGLAFGQQNNSNGYAWSPTQGNAGGNGQGPTSSGWWSTFYHGVGGGGGYGAAGTSANYGGGTGGAGVVFPFTGTNSLYAAGGGGGSGHNAGSPGGPAGAGQAGGAPGLPSGVPYNQMNCTRGGQGSGGGAGGGWKGNSLSSYNLPAAGGSGIVVIAYLKD